MRPGLRVSVRGGTLRYLIDKVPIFGVNNKSKAFTISVLTIQSF